MKKSISLIMVVCLSSILFFNNMSKAASYNASIMDTGSFRLNFINSYYPPVSSSDNPIGDYILAYYEGAFDIVISGDNTDGFINGYVSTNTNISISVPSGATTQSLNFEFLYSNNDYIRTYVSYPALYTMNFITIFDNMKFESIRLTSVTVKVNYTLSLPKTSSNLNDPPLYVSASTNSSITSSGLSTNAGPVNDGLAEIIAVSINNGDFNNKLTDLINLLTIFKNNETSHYTNILSAINNQNEWLEEIFTELDNWDQIWWPAIYAENQTQSSRLATVLSNLQTIISDLVIIDSNNVTWLTRLYNKVTDIYNYMQQSDQGATQAANAADQAAAQASQIAAVPRPNANAIINEGISRIDTDISSGFSVLGAILNQQWYIWILMIVISLAFVSYLMYGKGV